jgi:protein SCO1/2
VDVTGSPLAGDFHLVDADGKPRSLADFRGKVVVVTFGYTHCPDVCPTTLADFAAARKKLGAEASRVQVLFVTVDRSATRRSCSGVRAGFHPPSSGLRGDEAATQGHARLPPT